MGELLAFPHPGERRPAPALADRLAAALSDVLEAQLFALPTEVTGGELVVIRLETLRPDLAERVAQLLDEAGW